MRWYRAHRRDLPWRRTRDPYAVLVSEVMLQQTTVTAVEPYYRRFIVRFPDVRSLAQAKEHQVLAAWSGLGYYDRARRLRLAAQAVLRDHGGRVPAVEEEMRALPGVGRYTAAAVLSIAFDARLPVVDGNVSRVLARVFLVKGDVRRSAVTRRLWSIAGAILPRRGAGDHNQALMELGATVCTPSSPDCGRCPLSRSCGARRRGLTDNLPERGARPAMPVRKLEAAALVWRRGRILVGRRAGRDGLRGMWELPSAPVTARGDPRRALSRAMAVRCGPGIRVGAEVARVRHSIMNRRIEIVAFEADIGRRGTRPLPRGRFRWMRPGEPLALTGATRKILGAAAGLDAARDHGPP
jgi:A/G-specific adenine glycosylase